MSDFTLSLDQVRLAQLAAQGLLTPAAHPAQKEDVLVSIRQMGELQIDTINVVARSPYLVLFSRLGNYDPRWLEQLQEEGALFEYWAHAACFLPIEDYPLYVHRMDLEHHPYYSEEWLNLRAEAVQRVTTKLREEGAVRSADFERTDGRKGSWWDWKDEKRVLEYLHTTGQVMIVRRDRFQRIYDLRERVLPTWQESSAPDQPTAEQTLILKTVRCLGVSLARWVPDYFRLRKKEMPSRLNHLADQGYLLRAQVEGESEPAYIHPDTLPLLKKALAGELVATHTALLSPFDPLVWDRQRLRDLFSFDYTIECYTPTAKRQYGYFNMPILHRGKLIGRLDPKAHRKEGIFEIRSIHLEAGVQVTDELRTEVLAAIQRCADWHATPQVKLPEENLLFRA